MIVTLVSQCEKKALAKTRQILDAFANRIGDNTWQTVITQAGLDAVQASLRKTASKNTAVACHRLHGYSRTELVWIVGNRKKFNSEGHVPVHTTQANILPQEDSWHFLPLLKALTALAALFHDWGKATLRFQNKLEASCDPQKQSIKTQADPLRHEWISCVLLQAFIHAETPSPSPLDLMSDSNWLSRLMAGEIDETSLKKGAHQGILTPLAGLPPAAGLIAWLVLSHHRLPCPQNKNDAEQLKRDPFQNYQELLAYIQSDFGYQNKFDSDEYLKHLPTCFQFRSGLLSQSAPWLKQLKKWASKLNDQLPVLEQALKDGSWRLILHHSRLALMLGDHFYSSRPKDTTWQTQIELYANTDWEETISQTQSLKQKLSREKVLKQRLDEHLVHVAKNALEIAYLLPSFVDKLHWAQDLQKLKKQSPIEFVWQDKAIKEIKAWRSTLPEGNKIGQAAFFAVNMASTGCGKTVANAKVMRALSPDYNSLRYILALGLRTLTLQTGDEYRKHIGLDETQMAVMIGSQALIELHNLNRREIQAEETASFESVGSESLESLLESEVNYKAPIPDERLSTLFSSNKDHPHHQRASRRNQNFLYAPVLVCTIDHIMPATETKRGGRYILPCLRLLSSDLVIDEIDDFEGSDLIAIGRLIHLAGMLGRKVMISSATIPPDLAEGYFNAYREGWLIHSKAHNLSSKIACAWIDEFKTQLETISDPETGMANKDYQDYHKQFVAKRIAKLSDISKNPIRRKGLFVNCEDIPKDSTEASLEQLYFEKVKQAILELHTLHHTQDKQSAKKISFGVVRIANIEPCIALAKHLLQADWPNDITPKVMAYHSRQVMLLRSEQEKHLDQVLKRKESPGETPKAFNHRLIRQHINNTDTENLIFILVATPVEEIGRDHDFDWAVVEPSSFRSIIQLAGRVRRHRKQGVSRANIALLQFNLKALKGKDVAYSHPGYEQPVGNYQGKFKLNTHDLTLLLAGSEIEKSISAIPRIQKKNELQPQTQLVDLEHATLSALLTSYTQGGPHMLQGWLTQSWWLTAIPQQLNRFRGNTLSLEFYRVWEDESFCFMQKDSQGIFLKRESALPKIEIEPRIADSYQTRLWLERDYLELLNHLAENELKPTSPTKASQKYGEISLSIYGDTERALLNRYTYSDQFGLYRTK